MIQTYAAGDHGLRIIDVRDPSSPHEVGVYKVKHETIENIFVQENYAYVNYHQPYARDEGLRIIDVSNPSSPHEVGAYKTKYGTVESIYVTDHQIYVVGMDGISILQSKNLKP